MPIRKSWVWLPENRTEQQIGNGQEKKLDWVHINVLPNISGTA